MKYTIKNTRPYVTDYSYPMWRKPVKFTAEFLTFDSIEDAEDAITDIVRKGWPFTVYDFDIIDEAGNTFKGNFEDED